MRLTMVIDVSPTSDVVDDDEAREQFIASIKDSFESRYSADPIDTHETEDGEFSFEITHNEVKVEAE